MKRFLISILLLAAPASALCQDNLALVFWNLENFFDYKHDGTSDSEKEFSQEGSRHWTKGRFYNKCNAVAKTLLLAGEQSGTFPDIAGFCEVENDFVVRSICSSTVLRKLPLGVVHYESADPRGIDCALIYRKDRLNLKDSKPLHVCDSAGRVIATRDILHACFDFRGSKVDVLVNHHPSKYAGSESSVRRRHDAMRCMFHACDSLRVRGGEVIICIGDFNESPGEDASEPRSAAMTDISTTLYHGERGSIKFNGRWALIDRCFVNSELAGECTMKIMAFPHLTTRDSSFAGEKPLRTYSGPRYLGGVSDHYPVEVLVNNSGWKTGL